MEGKGIAEGALVVVRGLAQSDLVAVVLPDDPSIPPGNILVLTASGERLSVAVSSVSAAKDSTNLPPVVVFGVPGFGDCVLATKDFQPGDVMWSEAPLLIGEPSRLPEEVRSDTMRISAIPDPFGREETVSLNSSAFDVLEAFCSAPDPTRERVLCMQKALESDTPAATMVSRAASALMRHAREVGVQAMPVSDEHVKELLHISTVNSFSYQGRTAALFQMGCKMEHSCDGGNCYYHLDDRGHGVFSAKTAIKAFQHVSYSYLYDRYLWLGTEQRNAMLRATKGFSCKCSLCASGRDLYRQLWCPRCPFESSCFVSPLQGMPSPKWLASKCGREFNAEDIGKSTLRQEDLLAQRALALDDSAHQGRCDISLSGLLRLKDIASSKLGPCHYATNIMSRHLARMVFHQNFLQGQQVWRPEQVDNFLEVLELNEMFLRDAGSRLGTMPAEWDVELMRFSEQLMSGSMMDPTTLKAESSKRLCRLLDMAWLSVAGIHGSRHAWTTSIEQIQKQVAAMIAMPHKHGPQVN